MFRKSVSSNTPLTPSRGEVYIGIKDSDGYNIYDGYKTEASMTKTAKNKRKILLSLVYSLSAMVLPVFIPAFTGPVFAAGGYYTTDIIDDTKYIDQYFEVDKDGHWKMHIYLGDQKLMTIDDTGTTTYPLTDHLGSSSVITNQAGEIIEIHDYYPFGAKSYQDIVQDTRTKYLFTGKEADPENLLYYFGARYYDQTLGRFISVDPFGQKLHELADKKLNTFLSDPQRLNSYSYASNNPINNLDTDGNLTIKAFNHPGAAAAQLGFWYSGVNSYLKPKGLDTTAALLQHSLSWYPKDVNINISNQSDYGNIVDSIKQSSEYKSFVAKQISTFEKQSRNYFTTNDLLGSKSLGFSNGDLGLALGKVKIENFSGYRGNTGEWIVYVEFSDKYNFEFKPEAQEYNKDWFKTSANNAAHISQEAGVITNYDINIKFSDEIKY